MKNFIYLFLLTLLYSCSEGGISGISSGCSDNFDRKPLLENVVDNMIIPGHNAFSAELTELKTKVLAFESDPVSYTHLTLPTTPYV